MKKAAQTKVHCVDKKEWEKRQEGGGEAGETWGEAKRGNVLCADFNEQEQYWQKGQEAVWVVVVCEVVWRQVREGYFSH